MSPRCVMCKCLPSKCDCNPLAEDPDSFCSGGDVCKVRLVTCDDGDPPVSRTACVSPGSPPAAPVTPSPLTRTRAAPGVRPASSASVWRRAVTVMKTPPTLTSFVQQTSNARTASALPQGAIVTPMPLIQMTSVLQIKNARIASVWKKVTPPTHE